MLHSAPKQHRPYPISKVSMHAPMCVRFIFPLRAPQTVIFEEIQNVTELKDRFFMKKKRIK
jgi:hypothetical protein